MSQRKTAYHLFHKTLLLVGHGAMQYFTPIPIGCTQFDLLPVKLGVYSQIAYTTYIPYSGYFSGGKIFVSSEFLASS